MIELTSQVKSAGSHLLELGLNKYESKIYCALATEGILSAKELSSFTSIPYGKVYEVTNTLALKGFLAVLPSKPMKFQAAPPGEVISIAKKSLQQKLGVAEANLKKLMPAFAESRESVGESTFLLLKQRLIICEKIESLIKQAKDHILISTSENGLKRFEMYIQNLKKASKAGVKIQIMCPLTKNNPQVAKSFNFCDIKHSDGASNHFMSVDGDECILFEAIPDDRNWIRGNDVGLLVKSSSFTNSFENFFLSSFKNARPLRDRSQTSEAEDEI
jgi:sugar-specific transcriptional regulator TrmB